MNSGGNCKSKNRIEFTNMLNLKNLISDTNSTTQLLQKVKKKIKANPYIICPALNRRRVFTKKWIDVLSSRYKRGKKNSLKSFLPALELIGRMTEAKPHKNKSEWELIGQTRCGHIVKVHIREEKEKGDRLLFYISNFYKKKTI